MTKTNNALGISAAVFFACALVGVACDPGSTNEGGNAGSAGSANGIAGGPGLGGRTGSGGGPGLAGSGGRTSAGGSGGAGLAGANNCTPLPPSPLLTDFGPATFKATDGSSWTAGKQDLWGSAPATLSGEDVFYQGKPESAAKVTLHGQSLTVSATIAAGDYAGYMFSFKPACTNASSTQGLQFDVLEGSTLGNATLKVQMQQRSDYPSTANPGTRPGDCDPSSVETQYNDCLSPAYTVAGSGSSLSSGLTQLPWTSFAGGKPVPTVDSSQLMAIQWQFECPPDGGTASGTVSAVGGSGGAAGGGGTSSAGAGVGAGGTSGGAGTAGQAGAGGNSGGSDAGSGGGSGLGGGSGTGAAAAAGSSGESGFGGGSAASGSSGTAGTVGGSSGSSGSSSSGGSGSGGTAGSGAATTPPCVISFTLDNVTFY